MSLSKTIGIECYEQKRYIDFISLLYFTVRVEWIVFWATELEKLLTTHYTYVALNQWQDRTLSFLIAER